MSASRMSSSGRTPSACGPMPRGRSPPRRTSSPLSRSTSRTSAGRSGCRPRRAPLRRHRLHSSAVILTPRGSTSCPRSGTRGADCVATADSPGCAAPRARWRAPRGRCRDRQRRRPVPGDGHRVPRDSGQRTARSGRAGRHRQPELTEPDRRPACAPQLDPAGRGRRARRDERRAAVPGHPDEPDRVALGPRGGEHGRQRFEVRGQGRQAEQRKRLGPAALLEVQGGEREREQVRPLGRRPAGEGHGQAVGGRGSAIAGGHASRTAAASAGEAASSEASPASHARSLATSPSSRRTGQLPHHPPTVTGHPAREAISQNAGARRARAGRATASTPPNGRQHARRRRAGQAGKRHAPVRSEQADFLELDDTVPGRLDAARDGRPHHGGKPSAEVLQRRPPPGGHVAEP